MLAALRSDPRAGAQALYHRCLRRERAVQRRADRLDDMVEFETQARANGFQRVAGVDEAGRGPLAGPIVAAAVVLAEPVEGLDDSKRLSPGERERLFAVLHRGGHSIGVGVVDVETITATGIQAANYAAMLQAAAKLDPSPDFLLVDGFGIPGCSFPHQAIVKGDRRSLSIAAASVVAKVVRDRIMTTLDRLYPGYGFARHKGYATAEHLAALRRYGPCPVHRTTFAPIAGLGQRELFRGPYEESA